MYCAGTTTAVQVSMNTSLELCVICKHAKNACFLTGKHYRNCKHCTCPQSLLLSLHIHYYYTRLATYTYSPPTVLLLAHPARRAPTTPSHISVDATSRQKTFLHTHTHLLLPVLLKPDHVFKQNEHQQRRRRVIETLGEIKRRFYASHFIDYTIENRTTGFDSVWGKSYA